MMKPTTINMPTSNDILFGRDAESWNHEGNRSFRLLVAKFQDEYHSSDSRVKKVAIVAKIVKELQEIGARFLKRDKRLQIWVEVDRKAAIEKVGHAIRDKQIIAQRTIEKKNKQYYSIATSVKMRQDRRDSSGSTTSDNIHISANINSAGPPPVDYSLLLARRKQQELLRDNNALPTSAIRENLLLQHMMGAGAAPRHHFETSAHNPFVALRRTQMELEAVRKLAAAEEYFASLKKKQALEDEISFLRRRAMLLNSLQSGNNRGQGLVASSVGSRERSASSLLDLHDSLTAAAPSSLVAAASAQPIHVPSSSISSALPASRLMEQQLQSMAYASRRSFSSW